MANWQSVYLKAIGAPNTPQNRRLLGTWQRYEGGHTNNSARFNYLNTTQAMPGSKSMNSTGVQVYKNLQQGAAAFAKTLRSGRYGDLLGGFKSGDPYKANVRAGLSTWVSGSPTSEHGLKYAAKVLGSIGPASTPSDSPQVPADLAPPPPDTTSARLESLSQISGGHYDPFASLQALTDSLVAQGVGPGQKQASIFSQPTKQAAAGAADWHKWVRVPKAAGSGAHPNEAILAWVAGLARTSGAPLRVFDNTTHSKMTVDGNISAHWTGNALDIAATGAKLIRLGRLALIRAGMPRKQAMKQKGGLYNVGGHQIIFNTHIGGDHTNHVHVGIRH